MAVTFVAPLQCVRVQLSPNITFPYPYIIYIYINMFCFILSENGGKDYSLTFPFCADGANARDAILGDRSSGSRSVLRDIGC